MTDARHFIFHAVLPFAEMLQAWSCTAYSVELYTVVSTVAQGGKAELMSMALGAAVEPSL